MCKIMCKNFVFILGTGGVPGVPLTAGQSSGGSSSPTVFGAGTVALAAMMAAAAAAILTVSIILIVRYSRRNRADADHQTRHGPGSKFYGTVSSGVYGSVTSKLSKPDATAVTVGSGS